MRGRLGVHVSSDAQRGNTPAYAGKTPSRKIFLKFLKKHPRVCGEDCVYRKDYYTYSETPPRMRGRPANIANGTFKDRNTPAYAGKTRITLGCYQSEEKHPRVCGED